MSVGEPLDAKMQEYWSWLAVALFLLTTVDMVTTVYAVHRIGITGEANPIVRWSLLKGPAVLMAINLIAVVTVTVMFDTVMRALDRTPAPYHRYLAAGIEAWLAGLLVAGLLVFANNLMVIFFATSLI